MRNVDLDSAMIRQLFRARPSSSRRPPPTERERRAAASAADSEDAIGVASPDDQLPVHFDLQDWDRSRRRNFDWDDLYDLADYRSDVNLAVLAGVSAAKSSLVRLYQDKFQVPVTFAVDRTFVEGLMVAWFVSFLELWLVEGLGDWEFVEQAVMKAHFGAHSFNYGDDADQSEASTRLRHRFEWMIMNQTGRALTWADFEVVRTSRKHGSLLSFTSGRAVLRSGIRLDETRFPLVPRCLRHASLPSGLAIPPLLSVRLYAHFMGRHVQKLLTMPPGKELSAAVEVTRRWERVVELEFCCALLHCAVIERRQHARIPVYPSDLIDFILDTLPTTMINMDYPGQHYGTPRDTLNDLVQAASVGIGRHDEVTVPLCTQPVSFVSLDVLFDEDIERVSPHALLPVEEGAVWPPKLLAAKIRRSASKVSSAAVGAIDKVDQTPLPAASSGVGGEARDVSGGEGDSSPVASLSPVGTLRSGDLSPNANEGDQEEIQLAHADRTEGEISPEIQPCAQPMAATHLRVTPLITHSRPRLRSVFAQPSTTPPSSLPQSTSTPTMSSQLSTVQVNHPFTTAKAVIQAPSQVALAAVSCAAGNSERPPRSALIAPSDGETPIGSSQPQKSVSTTPVCVVAPIETAQVGSASTLKPAIADPAPELTPVDKSTHESPRSVPPGSEELRRVGSSLPKERDGRVSLAGQVEAGAVPQVGAVSRNGTDGATTLTGGVAVGSASQGIASHLADNRIKEDVAIVERVSRNGGLEREDGRAVVVPLDVVTNMRVAISDIFRDYPGWRIALGEYADCTWKIVALRDVCQRVAGWVRSQDPTRHRSARGGGGWRTKASQLEKANRSLGDTNAALTRRLDQANAVVHKAHDDLRHCDRERDRMLGDIAGLRRGLDDARASGRRVGELNAEVDALRNERDRLQARLNESERENHSLLRELVVRRRRRSSSPSRSPSPKRRRRSDGGWRGGPSW